MSGSRRFSPAARFRPGGWGVLGAATAAGLALKALEWRNRVSLAGRTVVITGGSRGLGLVLARQFVAKSARVALLARNRGELRRAESELAGRGGPVMTARCDVSDRKEVRQAVRQVASHFGGIDVLINNAGIIQVGPLEQMGPGDFERAMATHFFGPLNLTLEVLPYMRRAGGGRIVNISSIGGKVAVPHMAPYVASKFALTGLSDALRSELRRENIYVTTVLPGPMRTGSPPNAQFKGRHHEEYAWFAITDSLPILATGAERAARRIVRACRSGSPRLVLGFPTVVAILLNELFPGASGWLAAEVNRLLPRPGPGHSRKTWSGWQSRSRWAPSILTAPTDRAAGRNNERRGDGRT